MTDKTVEFFQMLSRRADEPMLRNVTATFRFDITSDGQTGSWRLEVDRGRLTVTAEAERRDADCVIIADKALFDGIAGDGVNAMAALLRGEIAVTGDAEFLVAVQRLFPMPTPAGR